jgi:small-conductance mechanosensitive channel
MYRFRLSRCFPASLCSSVLICVALAAPLASAAADAPVAVEQAKAETSQDADLVFMNRKLIRFRTTLLRATPQQRAERAVRNLTEILEGGGADAAEIVADSGMNVVTVNGHMAFVIATEDVDKLSGETLESLSQQTLMRLRQAIDEVHETRDGRKILIDLLFAAGETLLLFLLLWGLARMRRGLGTRMINAALGHADKIRLGGIELIRRDRMLMVLRWVSGLIYWWLGLVLVYSWLSVVLARFPYTRAWGEQLHAFLQGVVLKLLGGIVGAIPNLVVAALMFVVARGAVGVLSGVFDRVQAGSVTFGWLDRDTVGPTRKLAMIMIWIFALVMAYPYLPGAQTEAFKGMSVLLGLMISLGASSVVGQAACGLILMYARTIRRGEYVRIGDYEGTVMDLGMFNTHIRTGRGVEITLPNSLIVGTATQNYSRTSPELGFVIDTTVTIGYDTPWRQVQAMLVEAAKRTPGIVTEPPPRVFQLGLSDFYPEYCLVCHAIPTEPRPRAEVMSTLHASIQDVFNEYGVQIMSPHYFADPVDAKLVSKGGWYPAPAREERKD